MNNLVSIAIATYNGERYLRKQLDSIYQQTYNFIEVIVSDDMSTDGTVAILEEYKQRYGLKYSVNESNTGFVKNFETVLKMCGGEYIALCDQDDIWFPEKIETLVAGIGCFSLICSDAMVIDECGDHISESLYAYTKRKFFYTRHFNHLLYHNYITGCTMLFKRELLDKAIPFSLWIPYHDWWLALIASITDGIQFINKPLIKYRYHGNNQSPTGMKYKYSSVITKISEFREKADSGSFKGEIKWMEDLLTRDFIDREKSKMIKERIDFYKNIDNSLIHIKSAYIAFKHREYMLSKRNRIGKLFFIIMSLFAK